MQVSNIMRNYPGAIPERRRSRISRLASELREAQDKGRQHWFPVAEFLEFLHEEGTLELKICSVAELREVRGTCFRNGTRIQLRSDVFVAAKCGEEEARQTVAHGLGYSFLHTEMPGLRAGPGMPPPTAIEVLEQEVEFFADELLMPSPLVRRFETVASAMKRFGVPREVAARRLRWLNVPPSPNAGLTG